MGMGIRRHRAGSAHAEVFSSVLGLWIQVHRGNSSIMVLGESERQESDGLRTRRQRSGSNSPVLPRQLICPFWCLDNSNTLNISMMQTRKRRS
jgi:hypothetical protein